MGSMHRALTVAAKTLEMEKRSRSREGANGKTEAADKEERNGVVGGGHLA